MRGVGGRILDHFAREGALRPVSALKVLVQDHPEILLEQGAQPHSWFAEELRRDPGVEEPVGPKSVISIQRSEIVVGVVEQDLDIGVGEQATDGGQVGDRQRVDHRRLSLRAYLNEIHPIGVPVKRSRLGVERQAGLAPQPLSQVEQIVLGSDQLRDHLRTR